MGSWAWFGYRSSADSFFLGDICCVPFVGLDEETLGRIDGLVGFDAVSFHAIPATAGILGIYRYGADVFQCGYALFPLGGACGARPALVASGGGLGWDGYGGEIHECDCLFDCGFAYLHLDVS